MSEANAEVVEKAKILGWVAKEDYKGEPSKWRDAEEFVEFGERLNPILRENNKRLEAQLRERDAQIAQIRSDVEKFAKVHEETAKTAYAKALADLKAEKKAALENDDFDAVIALDDKIADTKAAEQLVAPVVPVKQSEPVIPQEVKDTYNAWASENNWIQNRAMDAYAREMGMELQAEGVISTGIHFRPFLDKVTEKVKERFPEKFENDKRTVAARVEGGGDGGGSKSAGKHTYAHLPQEMKESCDLLVKTNPGFTREKFCERYKW